MKKTFFILTLLFALAATPAIANQGKDKDKSRGNPHNIQQQVESQVETEEENGEEQEECGPNEEYKNHGKYVSCVAKTHPGGKIVSEAAKSDIGKKNVSDDDITPSPSVSPSVSPTASPSVSPTIEPSPSASPTAETSETEDNSALSEQIKGLIATLKELIQSLKNLATF